METTTPGSAELGIYANRAQLDHDTDMILDDVLADLAGRGVDRPAALASLRRCLKGSC